tara:strand:- start:2217 stop:2393 length:177 start_codon:yes stop_codon:yes gene_type:complete
MEHAAKKFAVSPLLIHNLNSAMAAPVMKYVHFVIDIPRHHYRLSAEPRAKEITRMGDL